MQRSAYLSEPWCSCADTRQALRACASSNLRRIGECFLVYLCAPSCDVCSDALRVFDSQFAGDQFRQQGVTESLKLAILLASLVRALTALRDTLLPKLISGELRVKDAERIAANVT